MKIGLVCPYDIHRYGGVQEHVLAQASGLSRRGHEVKILTPNVRKQNHEKIDDVEIIYLGNATNVRTPINTSLEVGVSLKPNFLNEILHNEAFDLLHIHEPEVPVLGAQIVARAQCPIIATFHAIHPNTPLSRTIETMRIPYSKSIFSRLSRITAVSDMAAGFVRQRTGREVAIIPNGIDTNKYMFKPSTHKHKNILYVGRLEKRKGVIYLIKAYEVLAKDHHDISLTIAGGGNLRSNFEKYVADNSIPRVTFLGPVEEEKKISLMHNAAVFCSPAIYGESFGIVLLEAISSGTVTVAGDNPGYKTVLKDKGQLGIVNPKDIMGFSRTLDIMLHDDEVRKLWLNWAKEYIKQYDYEIINDKYESIYQEVINSQ